MELEGGVTGTQQLLIFEARSSMSEGCAHRFGPLLVNLSERWDYLNEFEWSVHRVWVENMAVRMCSSIRGQFHQ